VGSHGIAVDVLVNNAGYGLYGSFADQLLSRTLNMVQLNMITTTELTHITDAEDDLVSGRGPSAAQGAPNVACPDDGDLHGDHPSGSFPRQIRQHHRR
jgi:hypothetical protein